MPGFDGKGPLGKGAITGKGKGYCIIKSDSDSHVIINGFIGIEGKNVNLYLNNNKNLKEVFMPGGDGTGPAGFGSMTGRAAGYCAGYNIQGYLNPIVGRGFFGRGRGGFGGRGRGHRNWFYATGLQGWSRHTWNGDVNPYLPYSTFQPQMTAEQEVELLKNQAKYMQEEISNVNERIKELESKPAKKEK